MNNYLKRLKKYDSLDDKNKEQLISVLYQEHGWSYAQIAKEADTYANRIRRDAKRFGVPARDKSQAQKAALESGRHPHPTKGVGHSDEAKLKISDSVANVWDDMPKKERNRRRKQAKELWDKKSPEEIKAFREAAGEGVRRAAKEGSALEQYLLRSLIGVGYKVEFHKEQWVIKERLQIDLYLPEENIAIEVDGPSHFEDIWGADQLQKNQQRDAIKTGLLLERGVCIIRVRQKQSLSQRYKREILAELLDALEQVTEKKPPKGKRHIILGE
jgi:very-short-patch-repair endonuclease